MKRLGLLVLLMGILCGCNQNEEPEETTTIPETIESTEETMMESTEEEVCEYHFVCEEFREEPTGFTLLTELPELDRAVYSKEIDNQNYLLVKFGQELQAVPTIGDKAKDYVWDDFNYDNDDNDVIVIMEKEENGDEEAFCIAKEGELQVAVFDTESLLAGGARGSAQIVDGFDDQDFLEEDIALVADEAHGQIMVDYRSQPYFIPWESDRDSWIKENGRVTFFIERDGKPQIPYLWAVYELPELSGKSVGKMSVRLESTSGSTEMRITWAEEVKDSVWKGPRFGQEVSVVSTSPATDVMPISEMDEFLVLASARPEDLANAWDYTRNGIPSDSSEIMKVGESENLTVYTVSTQDKAYLALYVWADGSLVFPIGGYGFDAEYGMQIYGDTYCCYTGMRLNDEPYQEWVAVGIDSWAKTAYWVEAEKCEISLEAAADEMKNMLQEQAGLPEEARPNPGYGVMHVSGISSDGRLKAGMYGSPTDGFCLMYGEQAWMARVPLELSAWSSTLYEAGPGEWILLAGIYDQPRLPYRTQWLILHIVAQADGTLLVERWN